MKTVLDTQGCSVTDVANSGVAIQDTMASVSELHGLDMFRFRKGVSHSAA